MRIIKYNHGWTRRHFLEHAARGIFAAGVIAPLWGVLGGSSDCAAAYPPELLSIDAYTRGKLKAGEPLDASNVDLVKELLDPVMYAQIKNDGRIVDLVPAETDLAKLTFGPFHQATLRNRGVHRIGPDGNVYTSEGKPWIGGNPFPQPKSADEILLSNVLAWGRHDAEADAMREWNTDADGNVSYTYEMLFVEWKTVGRVALDPKPYQPGHEDQLRITTSVMASPQDVRGFANLTVWSYDQRRFPAMWAYAPSTKRVRSLSPTERFDPMLPGETMFMSDNWMVGDPLYTWGDFKLVSKGPMLACMSQGAYSDQPGWAIPVCGGKSGKKYFRIRMELVPEAYVVELTPTRYSNCPYSKKHVWYDARTLNPIKMLGYDEKGNPLHHHETGYGTFERKPGARWPYANDRAWIWTYSLAMEVPSGKVSRSQLLPMISDGYSGAVEDPRLFPNYCSLDALRRLGR